MIKRRFFKVEQGGKDEASSDSSSSSSSSDSEAEAEAAGQSEDDVAADPENDSESEGDDALAVPKESNGSGASSSSGYESEDSSENVLASTSSDGETGNIRQASASSEILRKESRVAADKGPVLDDTPDCILKFKSVYKCRICPRAICLTEETTRAHLISKRHARSEKLMKENRLKVILNSDGEIENLDQETHAERHARIVALAQGKSAKKNKGRQRQRMRLKKRKQENAANLEKKPKTTTRTTTTKSPMKRRRKNES